MTALTLNGRLWLPKFDPWRILRPLRMFDGQFYPYQPLQFMEGLLSPIIGAGRNDSLLEILTNLGLLTNLKVCLDAGDSSSYGGSGQTWSDVSGNTEDFFLGATSGSEASDPAWHGTAGGRSDQEYFTQDGGDYFRYKTTNAAWMQTLHKDNAIFTVCFWFYPSSQANAVWGTMGSTAGNTGVRYSIDVGGVNTLYVRKAGVSALTQSSTATVTANAWNFVAMSLNEATGANGLVIRTNGTSESFTSTYSSPSTGNASFTMEIGAAGNALIPLAAGSRFAEAAIWQGTALTATNLQDIYEATRARFGV